MRSLKPGPPAGSGEQVPAYGFKQRATVRLGRGAVRGRLVAVGAIVLAGFAATILLYRTLVVRENGLIRAEFKLNAEGRVNMIERELTAGLEAVYSLIAFYSSSEQVERHEFRAFASSLLSHKSFIRALEWAPRIPTAQRAEHEKAAREEEMPDYQITEKAPDGSFSRAPERDEYFPVFFVEPLDPNHLALGFDLASEPVRREALFNAGDSGQLTTTGGISLVQESSGSPSLLVFGPIYGHQDTSPGNTGNPAALAGVVVAVLEIAEVVTTALSYLEALPMELQLVDTSDARNPERLYRYVDPRSVPETAPPAKGAFLSEAWFSRSLELAGRTWTVSAAPAREYISSRKGWGPWLALGLGLPLATLLSGYLLLLVMWTTRIEKTVAQRTNELRETNRYLEEFAYVASHDLRAPLRAISNLSEWIEEDLDSVLTEESRRHMHLLRSRVRRAETLIEDLLTYSRAGRTQTEIEKVDTRELLENVVFLLNPPERFQVGIPGPMPVLETAKAPLEQVFGNLIGNSVRHHDQPEGCVCVTARELRDFWEFSVVDDGPGIPPEFHSRVFQMFQTLQSRDKVEGSGMGLALVKKLVEGQGGQVKLQSGAARGSTFCFTWPKEPRPEESNGE